MILGVDFWNDSLLRLYKFQGQADTTAFVRTAFRSGRHPGHRESSRGGMLSSDRLSPMRLNTPHGLQDLHVTGILTDRWPGARAGRQYRDHGAERGPAAVRSCPALWTGSRWRTRHRRSWRRCVPGYEIAPAARSASMMEDALARIDSLQPSA